MKTPKWELVLERSLLVALAVVLAIAATLFFSHGLGGDRDAGWTWDCGGGGCLVASGSANVIDGGEGGGFECNAGTMYWQYSWGGHTYECRYHNPGWWLDQIS